MSRGKQSSRTDNRTDYRVRPQKQRETERRSNKTLFKALLGRLVPEGVLSTEDPFDGNIKWRPEQLAQEAIIGAWRESRNVSDAFQCALVVREEPLAFG